MSLGNDYFELTENDFLLSKLQKDSIYSYIKNSGGQLAATKYNIFDPELCKYAMYVYIKLKSSKYNKDLIRSFGIDPNTLSVGSLVPKNVADDMYANLIQSEMDNIKSQVSAKGITLSDNQLGALVSLKYNTGNINSFFSGIFSIWILA
jgi:hypothetical protein